jgi:hypothetical protein
MSACSWEAIHGFQSPYEFERFVRWLESQLDGTGAVELPVSRRYAGSDTTRERWFRCEKDGEIELYAERARSIWRLVEPDFPFRGVFGRVTAR